MEEATRKSRREQGIDLFRQLKRVFPRADHQEYYENGAWDMECLEIDLELVTLHREEAGAPEPPPLEEVPAPVLPEARPPQRPPPQRPPLPRRPERNGVSGKPLTPAPPAAPPWGGQRTQHGTQMFIDRWKLEPTRSRQMLQGLRPEAAQWIIRNFKPSATTKDSHTGQLRTFISKSRENTPWNGSAGARRQPPRPTVPGGEDRGIKRSATGAAIGKSGFSKGESRPAAAILRGPRLLGNPRAPLSAPANRQVPAKPNPPWGSRQPPERYTNSRTSSSFGAAVSSSATRAGSGAPPPPRRPLAIGADPQTRINKRAKTDSLPVSMRPRSGSGPPAPQRAPGARPAPPARPPARPGDASRRPTDQVPSRPRGPPPPTARNSSTAPRIGSTLKADGGKGRPGDLIKNLLG